MLNVAWFSPERVRDWTRRCIAGRCLRGGTPFAKAIALASAGVIAFAATFALPSNQANAKRLVQQSRSANMAVKVRTSRVHTTAIARGLPSDMLNNPRYAAIVVDTKTGKTLYEAESNSLRHPASITKVMTLYLLFEQLQAGRLSLETQLQVSAHAAAQSPTKLGLASGTAISVEDAIKGVVTRSANDAAVVIAEALGGSEANFAAIMTRKAGVLGMTQTRYFNASGLPDTRQVTTAHDLAILGMAIQRRFPTYFAFFSTRSFIFRGREIGGHNRLLGTVDGVDGIKTGYTNASGFNLLTSIKRDNRQLVAVVMGGRSAGSRDAIMRRLIDDSLLRAYAGGAVDRFSSPTPAAALADAAPVSAGISDAHPATRTAVVAESPSQRAAAPVSSLGTRPEPVQSRPVGTIRPEIAVKPAIASTAQSSLTLNWVATAKPIRSMPAAASPSVADNTPFELPDTTASIPKDGSRMSAFATPTSRGWIIQIGATSSEDGARRLIAITKAAAPELLAAATPFAEPATHNGMQLWRARFGGFSDRLQAIAACKALKKASFTCVAAKL